MPWIQKLGRDRKGGDLKEGPCKNEAPCEAAHTRMSGWAAATAGAPGRLHRFGGEGWTGEAAQGDGHPSKGWHLAEPCPPPGLCHATPQSFLCRPQSLSYRAQFFLCLPQSLSCRAQSFSCLPQSFLCRPQSLSCCAQSLSCLALAPQCLQGLSVLDLSANQLSGSLPLSWVQLQHLHYLYLNNNKCVCDLGVGT